MRTLYLILYIIAAVCFAAAAAMTWRPAPSSARVNLIALGLLAWVAVPLIADARAL